MKHSTVLAAATAFGLAFHVHATTYYWNSAAAEGSFADSTKWFLDAECTQPANAVPNYGDEAVISTPAQLTLADNNSNIGTFTMNAAVTFVSGALRFDTLSGSGTLTVGETVSFVSTINKAQVNVPIDIPEGHTLVTKTSGDTYRGFQFNGKITGKGLLKTGVQGKQRQYTYLECDMRDFEGSVEIVDDGIPRHDFRIGANGYSGKARWSGTTSSGGSAINQAGTYKLGAFKGWWYQAKTGDYDFNKNITMEIGALNAEDDSLGGRLSRAADRTDDGVNVRKVGTGTMEFSASGAQSLQIADGTVCLAADSALSYADNNQNVKSYINFVSQDGSSGGALKVAAAVTRDVSRWLKNSTTAPIVFDDEGRDWTWNTAIDASNTAGFTKRGNGTLTLTKTPAYTGTTTLKAGTLCVPAGTALGKVVVEGGRLGLYATAPYSEPTKVVTIGEIELPDGITLADVFPATATTAITFETNQETGAVTVFAKRAAAEFTWTGAANDGLWESTGNWSVGGSAVAELPKPFDTVVFPATDAAWTVTNNSNVSVTKIIVNGPTTFSIADASPIRTPMVCGEGAITFSGHGFFAPLASANSDCVVSNDLVFADTYAGTIRLNGAQQQRVHLYGDVGGSGDITIDEGSQRDGGALVYGDWQDFNGTFAVKSTNQYRRDYTKFYSVKSVSSNTVYTIWGHDKDTDLLAISQGETGVWKIGALSGRLYMQSAHAGGHVIEVGFANTDFACSGVIGHKTSAGAWYKNAIRKVGTGAFTNSVSYAYTEYAKEGTLYIATTNALPIDALVFEGGQLMTGTFEQTHPNTQESELVRIDPSAVIKNSQSAIAFDDGGLSCTWATALAESNIGGLTKLGAGTLTLSAAPKYTGWTTVKAGKLVVPEGTVLDVVADNGGEIEGATIKDLAFSEGYVFNTGTDEQIVATGAADVSNLTVYIENPTASGSVKVVRAGSITGTAKLAFPEGASDKAKAKWSLKVSNGLLKASSISPMVFVIR